MTGRVFKPNRAGYLAVLKSPESAAACHKEAQQVRRNVEAIEPDATDVVVDDYRTDRAASSVTVRHPQAKVWAVRDGLWTRAAAAAGLEVAQK